MTKQNVPSLAAKRPTTSHRGRTQSGDALQKAYESQLVREAIRTIFQSGIRDMDLHCDMLTAVANRIGVVRSRLGAWASDKGTNWITTDGIRAISRGLCDVGEHSKADGFSSRIVSDHPGRRLD